MLLQRLMEAAQDVTSNGNADGGYQYEIISWFETVSKNAAMVQTGTLGQILHLNYGVEYLKKWFGDMKIQDLDACALESLYASLVPLASHADFEPFIQRIADGDTAPILTQQPITTLSLRYVLLFQYSSSLVLFHLCFGSSLSQKAIF